MESRGRDAASAATASVTGASAQDTNTGILMRIQSSQLRDRGKLGRILKIFRTWACLNRCDTTLDSETAVNMSVTPRVELKRLYGNKLMYE